MSTILVHDEYKKGLYGIEEHEYLHVLFYLHESQPKDLKLDGLEYKGGFKGVFASRAPNRPSLIGLTTVRLLERNGRELIVWGLDTINGTPVLDIKPLALDMDMFYAMEAEKIVEIYPTLDAMKCKERA
ncbi:MAG: SAM-dependent methyltransferase [Candidatus Lokiarchaeota archaeon]|nr:SAM-dependent methyltransferase [Candidatus Lokiarchaeota archaeon]